MNSIFGLLVLAADIYAILTLSQSKIKTSAKVLWILLVVVLPILGFIIWYFAGPKK